MLRSLIAAAIALAVFSSAAEARHRHAARVVQPVCDNKDVMKPCAYQSNSLAGIRSIRVVMKRVKSSSVAPAAHSTGGLNGTLAAKVAEIQSTCGSRMISGVRHTRIAGTNHWSQHANGTAADMSGNPSCIYGQLQGWAGGYSIDYARMRHVHISIGGPEAGLRFVHGGHRHHYARRGHHRYASAR